MSEINPFNKMTFGNDRCFLCGKLLTIENRTKEHVYPRWLQKKFGLWNDSLTLLNGTNIQYRKLTVPCCKKCNQVMSQKIEKPIQQLVDEGYYSFINCNKDVVFQWLTKISYGILYKELSLKIDRSKTDSESIYDSDDMKARKMEYTFLKSIVNGTIYHNKPYSILVFRIKNDQNHYWAWDNPFIHTFCMQMNDIGIVSCLMDNNANEQFFMQFEKQRCLLDQHIHPAQFLEICAKFVYKASLLYKKPFYLTFFDEKENPADIVSIDMADDLFMDWSQEEYGRLFGSLLKENNYALDVGDPYQGNDLVYSILYDENGKFLNIPL